MYKVSIFEVIYNYLLQFLFLVQHSASWTIALDDMCYISLSEPCFPTNIVCINTMGKSHSGTSNRAGHGTVVHNGVIVIRETECESSILSLILAFTCQDKI